MWKAPANTNMMLHNCEVLAALQHANSSLWTKTGCYEQRKPKSKPSTNILEIPLLLLVMQQYRLQQRIVFTPLKVLTVQSVPYQLCRKNLKNEGLTVITLQQDSGRNHTEKDGILKQQQGYDGLVWCVITQSVTLPDRLGPRPELVSLQNRAQHCEQWSGKEETSLMESGADENCSEQNMQTTLKIHDNVFGQLLSCWDSQNRPLKVK